MTRVPFTIAILSLFAATCPNAAAQGINLDIGGYNDAPSAAYGAASGQAGHWNRMLVVGGGPMNDLLGAPTSVTVHATNALHFDWGFDNPLTTGDDELLLDGGHDGDLTLVFDGLQNGNYYIYTYAFPSDDRTTYKTAIAVTNSPSPLQIIGGEDWTGTHIQGRTFARHFVTVTDGTVEIACSIANLYATVNGVQIEPTPAGPTTYCTPKVNSLGCTPTMLSLGTSSASATSGFLVRSAQNHNQRPGLLLYGTNGRSSLPFLGGTLCVNPPLRRSITVQSGGTALPAFDCSGVFSLDMNAYAQGLLPGTPAPAPALATPGYLINCQFWGRDPTPSQPDNKSLSPGLEYLVGP